MHLYRRYPALWAFLFFGLGILFSLKYSPWISLLLVLPSIILRKTPILLLFFITLGAFRTLPHSISHKSLVKLRDRRVQYEIRILKRKEGEILSLALDGKKITIPERVLLANAPPLSPGTAIKIEGRMRRRPRRSHHLFNSDPFEKDSLFSIIVENWDYLDQGILGKLRTKLENYVREVTWNSQNRMLLMAFLAGVRRGLRGDIKEAFKKSGIYHTLALSGLHLGIIGGVTESVFSLSRIQRPLSGILTVIVLGVYAKTVGIRPSLMRALIFFAVFILSFSLSRRHSSINALGVAGLLSLLYSPFWILDLGFQLSYLATFGILSALPYLRLRNLPKTLRLLFLSLGISISAQLFTAPILASTFGRIPLLGPLSNLIAVPLLTLILTESLILLIFFQTPLRFPLEALLNFLLSSFWYSLKFLNRLDLPLMYVKISTIQALVCYLFLGCLLAMLGRLRGRLSR